MVKIKEKLYDLKWQKIQAFLPILLETLPLEIGLYGSLARGDFKASSDIDLYVLYEEMPKGTQKGEIYEEAYDRGIDLLISSYKAFYETDSVFCKNVLRDRKIIWKK
ncbi:nucleotidyltransferase family protein [Sporanaerobium hydrogeniformans]|uniref:nucleotidyltransferase family protein n=1 Tax=Sporanaerobium hydrogeniformans TaxID=3072179 RepID=UPI0015D47F4B|nr:nucleotidyltransferase domain-containing protein [Sporanaerobium hydrogeniformans]